MANAATTRQTRWAHKWKAWLLAQLGGKCALCGSKQDLEVDHVHGRSWCIRDYSQAGRVRKYLAEFHQGVKLRALCRSCNGGYNPYKK